jgi:hypothetical protein
VFPFTIEFYRWWKSIDINIDVDRHVADRGNHVAHSIDQWLEGSGVCQSL